MTFRSSALHLLNAGIPGRMKCWGLSLEFIPSPQTPILTPGNSMDAHLSTSSPLTSDLLPLPDQNPLFFWTVLSSLGRMPCCSLNMAPSVDVLEAEIQCKGVRRGLVASDWILRISLN